MALEVQHALDLIKSFIFCFFFFSAKFHNHKKFNPAQFCSNLPIHIFWGPNDYDNGQLLTYIQGSLHKVHFSLPESCRRTYNSGFYSINCQSYRKMVSRVGLTQWNQNLMIPDFLHNIRIRLARFIFWWKLQLDFKL